MSRRRSIEHGHGQNKQSNNQKAASSIFRSRPQRHTSTSARIPARDPLKEAGVDSRRGYSSGSDSSVQDSNEERQYRHSLRVDTTYDLGSDDDWFCDSLTNTKPALAIPAWPADTYSDRCVVQLLSVQSAEHKTFRNKRDKIVLVCPKLGESTDRKHLSTKFRWL